ncbi:unnamed protein product [Notodromas monacha]|uniref:Nucleolar complex protein 2 homolog n=1 Tax=Notodromas monacha TaxID=399045 RepID=A0A7R9GGS1_9CRUS|nr:unnamed protein product [Notodromas monacha]CAG0920515.1 unnamed protein product [Notodromas monacha]
MTAWRTAGLNYIRYSAIAAKTVRRALKPEARAEAAKRETSALKVTLWKDGKPQEIMNFQTINSKMKVSKKASVGKSTKKKQAHKKGKVDDFDEELGEESDVSSESDEDYGTVHKPPAELEVASDEEDFEGEGEHEDDGANKVKITLKLLSTWTTLLRTESAKKLLPTIADVVNAFEAAAHSASNTAVANLPKKAQKDLKKKESEKKPFSSRFVIHGDAVFNAVIQLCLLELLPALNRFLKLSTDAKHTVKMHHVVASRTWKRADASVRRYCVAIFRMLECLGDSGALVSMLKHVHQLVPYLLASKKRSLTQSYLKSLIGHWSSSPSDTARLLAFMSILRIVRNETSGLLDKTMKTMYKHFVRNSKFASRAGSAKWISFMKRSMAEMYTLDEALAYRHGFVYIRQLAIHLRNATTLSTKNASELVFNWQYLHCLDFWGHVLSVTHPSDVLSPLIYPLTQVTIGTISLTEAARLFPAKLFCIKILVELGRRTKTYIPTLPFALDALNKVGLRVKKKKGTVGGNTFFDFSRMLKVSAGQTETRAFQDSSFAGAFGALVESFHSNFYSVSFPELAFPAVVQMRSFLKSVKVINYCRKVKLLLDKVLENSRYIQEQRAKQKMTLDDMSSITNFEIRLEQEKKAPFLQFYMNWKSEEERKEVLLHQDEVSVESVKDKRKYEAQAKKEKAEEERMEKQRKKDRKELKELFMDSDEENASRKRKNKSGRGELETDDVQVKKQKVKPVSQNGEDVVEELDASDFEFSSSEEEDEERPSNAKMNGNRGKHSMKKKKARSDDSEDSDGSIGDESDESVDDDDDDEMSDS